MLSYLIIAGTRSSQLPSHVSKLHIVGEARLNFQVLPDGSPPANFGPGPALLTVQPADDPSTKLRIVGGKLTDESTLSGRAAGYYTSASLGAPITTIGARWTFTPRGGTPGAMALVVSRTALHPPFSVHLVITPNFWSFGVWPFDGAVPGGLQTLRSQDFRVPLKEDGTRVYKTQVRINGERADLELPDGLRQMVRDHRIADWAGSFATFEAFSNHGSTDSRVGFTEIWAQSGRVQ
ncbi:hypothetical protein [uncultured Mycobacterium sp.]|uniref:hypothetical protein n=1 Tax=uncultured Mycobacterium sp. TaxID=171292 RepID=UPI0035CB7AEA